MNPPTLTHYPSSTWPLIHPDQQPIFYMSLPTPSLTTYLLHESFYFFTYNPSTWALLQHIYKSPTPSPSYYPSSTLTIIHPDPLPIIYMSHSTIPQCPSTWPLIHPDPLPIIYMNHSTITQCPSTWPLIHPDLLPFSTWALWHLDLPIFYMSPHTQIKLQLYLHELSYTLTYNHLHDLFLTDLHHLMLHYTMICNVTSHVMSCHMPHHAMPCHISHITSCHVESCHVTSCQITYHIISSHAMSSHAISCNLMSYHIISWHVMSHHVMTSHHIYIYGWVTIIWYINMSVQVEVTDLTSNHFLRKNPQKKCGWCEPNLEHHVMVFNQIWLWSPTLAFGTNLALALKLVNFNWLLLHYLILYFFHFVLSILNKWFLRLIWAYMVHPLWVLVKSRHLNCFCI